MSKMGYIQQNPDAIEDLLQTVINRLSSHSLRLAIWVVEDIDLFQFDAQRIGAESPFIDSDSILAGSGYLILVGSSNIKSIIEVLSGDLIDEIIHIEIESNGEVEFAAYDFFECICFGKQISVEILEDLKSHNVILSYSLFDAEVSEKE